MTKGTLRAAVRAVCLVATAGIAAACAPAAVVTPSPSLRIPAESLALAFTGTGSLNGPLSGTAECDHAPSGLAVVVTGTVGPSDVVASLYIATPLASGGAAYAIYGRNGETTVWVVATNTTNYAAAGTVVVSATGVEVHAQFAPTSALRAVDGTIGCKLARASVRVDRPTVDHGAS